MIKNYLSLIIGIFIQLVIINLVFGQVNFDKDDENYDMTKMLTNVLELVVMIIVTISILYYFLRNMMDTLSMTLCILISSGLILLYWLVYKTNLLGNYIKRVEYEVEESEVEESDQNHSNPTKHTPEVTKSDTVSFSKYHNKDNNRDFSFENSYPDYNKIKPSLEPVENTADVKDYSMYNGYDPSNICYKCGCITDDDGYTFCGKQIPGMGTIGCSERWECRNCKDCKCLETDAGKICGRVSRVDGFVKKCSSNCSNCDKCYGDKDKGHSNYSNNEEMIIVNPSSSLKRVVVNNIKNTDLNDILD